MDHWYSVVLALLTFLKASSQQRPSELLKLEEGMTLHCVCPWEGNLSMVSWTLHTGVEEKKKKVAVYHPVRGAVAFNNFVGRVHFLRTSTMDGSISISNVSSSDVGLYSCSVQTFPKGSWTKDVRVIEEVSFTQSKPDSHLTAEMGDNLTLRCAHYSNGTVYQVTFAKVEEKSIQIVALCHMVEGNYVAVGFRGAALLNCSDILDIRLQLLNVTKGDGGLYRCFFNSDTTGHTTKLSVSEKGSFISQHMVYIYTGGAALVLLVGITTIILIIRRKKRRTTIKGKPLHIQKRPLNNYEQTMVYDRMKKRPRNAEDHEIYCNLPSHTWRTKKKSHHRVSTG